MIRYAYSKLIQCETTGVSFFQYCSRPAKPNIQDVVVED